MVYVWYFPTGIISIRVSKLSFVSLTSTVTENAYLLKFNAINDNYSLNNAYNFAHVRHEIYFLKLCKSFK